MEGNDSTKEDARIEFSLQQGLEELSSGEKIII